MNRTQAHRSVAVGTPLGDDVLLLRSMAGAEGLGRLFQFDLSLLSEDIEIPFEDLIGKDMTVRLDLGDGRQRHFHGFVSRFVQTEIQDGIALYEATLVPWLWFLTRTADCRIFQDMTVPEIIKDVFRGHGFTDFDDALSASYAKREYCVQYRETDFNFVSRLMEQEGIYYHFRHENGRHALVLADSRTSHEAPEGHESIPFHPPTSDQLREREHVWHWVVQREVQPGAYALTDFDYRNPKKGLDTRSAVAREHEQDSFEVYDYPGEYRDHPDGEAYARIRIEELQARQATAAAASNVRALGAGMVFELENHPRADQCVEHLVTSAQYSITSDEFTSEQADRSEPTFVSRFTAMATTRSYRPARVTPDPRVGGPQTAIVVGKEGEEIWTDALGRVKVQFHWDRYGRADEHSSCWVRVSQGWAGKGWGAITIPRIGQEVIVDFLEGDPDRPIITGRVYNGNSTPPYDLPQHATISTVKSNSSKGGGGFNEIRFEDRKGEEQLFVHGQRNQDVRIRNDRFETIERDRHLVVGNEKLERVGADRHERIGGSHRERICGDRHLNVGGPERKLVCGNHSVTVRGDVARFINGADSESSAKRQIIADGDIVVESGLGTISLNVGESWIVIGPSGITIKGPQVVIESSQTRINSGPGQVPTPIEVFEALAPVSPDEADEADRADPGQMARIKAEQRQTGAGKYGSTRASKHARIHPDDGDDRKSWIEIELVDEDDEPVPGEPYRITLPDGQTVATGALDEEGFARVDGIDPGTCRVTFPELDEDFWEPA